MRRLVVVLAFVVATTACTGSSHAKARVQSQPLALADLNGHQALVITKAGTYNLRSPLMDDLGHPGPQLTLSSDVCNYLSGSLRSLTATRSTGAEGTKKETMLAALRVTTIKHSVIVGYEFSYTLLGPDLVTFDGRATGPRCLEQSTS